MSRRSSISDTVGSAIAGDVATEVGRIARSRRRSHVESTKAASLFTGSCYRDLPAMMLERRVISCKRHDELVLLGTDELSVKISSSEILELAVALGVTPSASAFWQRHKSIEDALSLIIEDKMAREGARYAALVESEESYLATIRARATTASDVLPDSGAPSALSSAAGACDRPSSSGVTRSRRSSASLRSSASQVDVAATADGPLAAPDRAIESSQPLRAGAGALHETDPLESKSTRAGLNSAHSSGGALESTADIRVATLTKVSDTTLAAIVSPHLPQVIPISQLEEFVKGHTSDAPEESAVSGEIPSRLAALESLLKIDALLSVSKSSNGQRMTLMVERENRPEDSLPPIAAEAADMASAVAALRASEPRLQVQLNKAPVPRAAPSGAAARVTASSTRPAFPESGSALLSNLGANAASQAFSPPRNAEPFLRALGLKKHILPLAVGELPPEPPKVGEGYWPADLFKPETFQVSKADDNYVHALGQLAILRDAQARRKRDEDIDSSYFPKR